MSNASKNGRDVANPTDAHSGPSSSFDLQRDSSAVQAVRVGRAAGPAAAEPRVTRGAPLMAHLPASYFQDSLRVVQRGPKQVAVFWDVNPGTAERYANSRWGLLVHTQDGLQRVEIRHGAQCWYVDVASAAQGYRVEFGPLDDDDNVTPIAATSTAAASPMRAVGGMSGRDLWAQAAVDQNGTQLEVVAQATGEADTDALLERSRVAVRASSPMHSWF